MATTPSLPFHLSPAHDGTSLFNSFSGVDIKVGMYMGQQDPPMGYDDPNQIPFMVFGELQTLAISSFRSTGPVRCLGESAPRAILRGARTIGGSMVFAQFNHNAFHRMMRISQQYEVYNADEPFFIDQIPPFDILCLGSNEYGSTAGLSVGGVTIGQTGTTLSVHDIFTEATYTFTARYYIPWSPLGSMRELMKQEWFESNQAASAKSAQFAQQLAGGSQGGLEVPGNEAHQIWIETQENAFRN